MIKRSKPLRYKIVRFLKPKFRSHKKLYIYHCIKVELFESATWEWKLFDEMKLLQEESLHRMINVSMNGSLHRLTWKRSVFAFDVKRESHCLFPYPLSASEGNDNKDIRKGFSPWMLPILAQLRHQEQKAQLVHCSKTWFSRRNNPDEMWRIARTTKIKSKSWWARGR
jgi:hypothetical protein